MIHWNLMKLVKLVSQKLTLDQVTQTREEIRNVHVLNKMMEKSRTVIPLL